MSQEESKPQTESVPSAQPQSPVWERPVGGVPEVYSDYFHTNWMPVTVRIRLGQVIHDPKLPQDMSIWMIGECVELTMPWATVKALAETLSNLVQGYEKENGPIVIPKIPSL